MLTLELCIDQPWLEAAGIAKDVLLVDNIVIADE
jgi:hypothetical protein